MICPMTLKTCASVDCVDDGCAGAVSDAGLFPIPDPTNPKDVEARKLNKVPLDLLEPVAEREIARAIEFGAKKYGVRNYVQAAIHARVYVAAMKRHIDAWLEGEDLAEDSGVHHLGHIGANVHVALAAIAAGTFVDDRHERLDERSILPAE